MNKITLIAVGRIKEQYFSEAVKEYEKRLSRYCSFSVVEVKENNFVKNPSPAERQAITDAEGAEILKRATGRLVAATPEGEKITSEEFARVIKSALDSGEELTFAVGGSYGLSSAVKRSAKKLVSFSGMTFPHTLFRVMLVEQIYRAMTIIAGAEYHK